MIRCCGLTVELDEDRAMDVDGIADAVDDIEQASADVSDGSSSINQLD